MTQSQTRATLESILRGARASDHPTIAFMVSATAAARHRDRVARTAAAAAAMAAEVGGTSPAAVLLADLAGVGGTAAVTGAKTIRVLGTLGTGRWHARDGGAYLTAAIAAIVRTVAIGQPIITPAQLAALIPVAPGQVATVAAQVVAALVGAVAPAHRRLRFERVECFDDEGIFLKYITIYSWDDRADAGSAGEATLLCRTDGSVEDWVALLGSALAAPASAAADVESEEV